MAQTNPVNDPIESEDQWDLETPVPHEKPRRALVSVSFNGVEMALVAQAAAREQMKLSTYIKEAALVSSERTLSSVTVINTSESGTSAGVEASSGLQITV